MIEFNNVSFQYNSSEGKVLDNVSFSVKEHEWVSILGHNGSGKSTIAKLMIGLFEPCSGTISYDGVVLSEDTVNDIRKKVGIVFQNPDNQFIGSTVEDDIAFGLENRCVEPSKMQGIIEEYANKVGMINFLKHEPTALSGGQKQRVAIAGALALNPNLLILDEATSMLDPKGKKDINSVIYEIKKNNPKMAILSITHHIDEALLADEIIVLNNGSVAKVGTPSEILYDEKLLKENSLLPPFVVEVKNALKDAGVKIDECFTMEELVSKL